MGIHQNDLRWQLSSKARTGPSFLDFPLELRMMILELVLKKEGFTNLRLMHKPKNVSLPKLHLIPILMTCRQLHYEGARLLYGSGTFVYSTHVSGSAGILAIRNFPASAVGTYRSALRHLYLHYCISPFGLEVLFPNLPDSLQEISTHFPNLATMMIHLDITCVSLNEKMQVLRAMLRRHPEENREQYTTRLKEFLLSNIPHPSHIPKFLTITWRCANIPWSELQWQTVNEAFDDALKLARAELRAKEDV